MYNIVIEVIFQELYNMAVEVVFEESVEMTIADIHKGDFWL